MDGKKETAERVVRKLCSGSAETKRRVVSEIRLSSKQDVENRVILVQAGALSPLVGLLPSLDAMIQENAITALLNLSIHSDNKVAILNVPGGLEAIVHVIREGLNADAKANAAALLYSLVVEESLRPVVGSHIPVLSALLELLTIGSSKCKSDCLKALFYTAMSPSNKPKLVGAGAVPRLLALCGHGKAKLTEGCLAVLAQIAGCPEGAASLLSSDSAIPDIISFLNNETRASQENAASTLFNVCVYGKEEAIREVLDDIRCIPALRKLYISASLRGKHKAEALMNILDVRVPPFMSFDSSDAASRDSVDGMAQIEKSEKEPPRPAPGLRNAGLGRKFSSFGVVSSVARFVSSARSLPVRRAPVELHKT